MDDIYATVEEDFYDKSLRSPNPFTRHYHRQRYARIRGWVGELYQPGMQVLDVGCGSCEWNTAKLPAWGLDKSEKLLERGRKTGHLAHPINADFEQRLPFEDGKFGIVVLGEVLEHLENPDAKLREIWRVLAPGGRLILTVPYDRFPSLWSILFPLQCAYMGTVRNDPYYKAACGHINHFTPSSLRELLHTCGFEDERMETWLTMNIAAMARKPESAEG
ncbi:Ubiquinone/menaquinone biosynthesis C-methyltransferase UbiE [uncultured archaeon]|nr:Ubiquinone/menaquinone biosynthesis C-methyltransferase UbiE [uncultured archaeon]